MTFTLHTNKKTRYQHIFFYSASRYMPTASRKWTWTKNKDYSGAVSKRRRTIAMNTVLTTDVNCELYRQFIDGQHHGHLGTTRHCLEIRKTKDDFHVKIDPPVCANMMYRGSSHLHVSFWNEWLDCRRSFRSDFIYRIMYKLKMEAKEGYSILQSWTCYSDGRVKKNMLISCFFVCVECERHPYKRMLS